MDHLQSFSSQGIEEHQAIREVQVYPDRKEIVEASHTLEDRELQDKKVTDLGPPVSRNLIKDKAWFKLVRIRA